MKRISLSLAMIAGILALFMTSSVSFAHDFRPFKSRHGKVVVVERHYVVHSHADPYRCVTPYPSWYYDRPYRYAHRSYDAGYDSRDAYGVRGVIHRPSGVARFSIGHWQEVDSRKGLMLQKVEHGPRFFFTVDGLYSGIQSLTVFKRTATVRRIVDDAEGFKNLVQTHITSAFLAYREDSQRFHKDEQVAYSVG